MGGVGAIWRTALGVLFVAMINNGFTLLGLNPTYEQIVQGASSCWRSVWMPGRRRCGDVDVAVRQSRPLPCSTWPRIRCIRRLRTRGERTASGVPFGSEPDVELMPRHDISEFNAVQFHPEVVRPCWPVLRLDCPSGGHLQVVRDDHPAE